MSEHPECVEISCTNTPTHIVYWPGKNIPPRYCKMHAEKAMLMLELMGCGAVCEEIKAFEQRTGEQK